jgi:Leucine-rich repeat (LRR) protein
LDISSNPLGAPDIVDHSPALPDYFFHEFPSLTALNISNCSLSELPWADIQKYSPLLLDLDISYNKFTSIQLGQLDVTRLRNISLKGNPIDQIVPGAMRGMYLEVLNLGELPQDILTPELFNGVRIERLVLSDMGLDKSLQNILLPLADDLVGLDVSGNPDLPVQGRMFEFLPYLAEVSLARMNWDSIKANIFRYENEIETLDLSENRFEWVTPAFFQPLTGLAVSIKNVGKF